MHELAICQQLIGEVEAVARARSANSVTDIYVEVGPLSGVEPPLMQSAFSVASAGTIADGAMLHLEKTPVRVSCSSCGAVSRATINRLVCGQCGNWRTQLESGDELLLQRIAMQTDQQEASNV
jgi:hydrogenase nickel incorporation protein HypA/HybF